MRDNANTDVTKVIPMNASARIIKGTKGSVGLTPREFELLVCLVDHAGNPVSRAELLRDAWNWDYATELKTKTVDMHVRRLRVKLERAGFDPKVISTVRGCGYAFTA